VNLGVLYDGQIYSYSRTGGIARYFANLLARLPADARPVLTLSGERGTSLPWHPNLRVIASAGAGRRLLAHRLAGARLRRAMRAVPFDLAHPTYYSLTTGRRIGEYAQPVVVTVWDMIHERFRDDLDPRGRVAAVKEAAIRAADRVICISESTRRDVVDRYGLDPDRLVVTHLAADVDATMSHGPEPVPAQPYFLYVGSRGPSYKNFWGAARAFRDVRSTQPDVTLALVGAPLSAEERRRLTELGIAEAVREFPGAGDCHLAKLYRCALALVYPSLYEGFGIPPLEAMQCGTAVVAGRVASIPEVVGDAALLVDPSSAPALADAMSQLLDNPARRDDLVARGAVQAAGFDWDLTAATTLDVYRSLL